jgi:hypothetical protein
METVIADAGPLVAYLKRDDKVPDDDQTPGSRLAESPIPYRVRRRPARSS